MPNGLNMHKKMSENCIQISKLNDFIFCPVSIYFHQIDDDTDRMMLQEYFQINGTAAHQTIDNGNYITSSNVLQSTSVYSEEYNLIGKIDTFDIIKGILTERKKKIVKVYDGYIFQLYAQYFGLTEMGYKVKKIRLYSLDDNKVYDIELPENDEVMFTRFKNVINDINEFKFDNFKQENIEKCKKCIYRYICSFTDYDEDL